MSSTQLFEIFLTLELFFVSLIDLKYKKISNYWSIGNILLTLGLFLFWKESYVLSLKHFAVPLGFLVVGFGLFSLKIMGAGDVKFISTFFLLLPEIDQLVFLNKIILLSVLVGFVFLLINLVKRRNELKMELYMGKLKSVYFKLGSKVPYAPVVFLAWIANLSIKYLEI